MILGAATQYGGRQLGVRAFTIPAEGETERERETGRELDIYIKQSTLEVKTYKVDLEERSL